MSSLYLVVYLLFIAVAVVLQGSSYITALQRLQTRQFNFLCQHFHFIKDDFTEDIHSV